MKAICLIQLGLIIGGYFLAPHIGAQQHTLSYLFGSGLVLANLLILTLAWSLILRKKLVALAVTVIVFKYAILGVIIYRLLQDSMITALGFCVGLSTLMVTALIYAGGDLCHSTSPH